MVGVSPPLNLKATGAVEASRRRFWKSMAFLKIMLPRKNVLILRFGPAALWSEERSMIGPLDEI